MDRLRARAKLDTGTLNMCGGGKSLRRFLTNRMARAPRPAPEAALPAAKVLAERAMAAPRPTREALKEALEALEAPFRPADEAELHQAVEAAVAGRGLATVEDAVAAHKTAIFQRQEAAAAAKPATLEELVELFSKESDYMAACLRDPAHASRQRLQRYVAAGLSATGARQRWQDDDREENWQRR